ncbi:hypothetical protein [Paenibacillus sp. NFR01]|uniref:hypothetical protein n=1 Tax=Paenibacillus sp. NFR01 TaxID=1566279 RepID=UPI0008AEA64C|nr:hypothetical protein [Paenibacillus sp. NFR01]SEU00882.1 hypothetical protein SAMN03159358_3075 [Paenibacillus sp. NFR01]
MNNKKWLIALVAAGMAVTGSAGVYAGTKLEQIKAYLNHGIGVVVDGSPYWLRDGNGKTLTPITYNGLTYLPVRSVADALHVPVYYDAANGKVRIGEGAVNAGSSGSSGSGNSGGTPVETVARPVNLPADFPIPQDAVLTITVDTNANGVKKAAFSYSTQETLDTMGFVYSEYARIKRLDNASQSVSASSVKISGRLGGTSPVSIVGKPSTAKPGFNIFTITWSES